MQVHLRDSAVKVFTRRGNDWTNRFRKIAADAWHITAGSAIIDGEVVVPAANGTTDFSVLQNELKGRSSKIVLVVFDLLYLDGYDLRKLPLFERKALLRKIIADTDVQFSESFEVDGREMFAHACATRQFGQGPRSSQGTARPHLSSSGCTHLYGVISCVAVSLIMCTGGACRPFLHDRHFRAASSFQIGVSRGRRMALSGRLARVLHRLHSTSSQPNPPFRHWPIVGDGCAGPP